MKKNKKTYTQPRVIGYVNDKKVSKPIDKKRIAAFVLLGFMIFWTIGSVIACWLAFFDNKKDSAMITANAEVVNQPPLDTNSFIYVADGFTYYAYATQSYTFLPIFQFTSTGLQVGVVGSDNDSGISGPLEFSTLSISTATEFVIYGYDFDQTETVSCFFSFYSSYAGQLNFSEWYLDSVEYRIVNGAFNNFVSAYINYQIVFDFASITGHAPNTSISVYLSTSYTRGASWYLTSFGQFYDLRNQPTSTVVSYYTDFSPSFPVSTDFFGRLSLGDDNPQIVELRNQIMALQRENLRLQTEFNNAFNSGVSQGYSDGYSNGYETGKIAGAAGSNDYSFFALISSVVDVPVQTFASLFNFELLGFNLLNFFLGIITTALIIKLLKWFL